MDVGGRDENVDPFALRGLQRLSGEIDIALVTPRQRGDDGTSDCLRDVPNTAKIALRGRREAGFDHVHTQRVELPGQAQLAVRGHGVSRCLLAVTQRGIEDDHVPMHGFLLLAPR